MTEAEIVEALTSYLGLANAQTTTAIGFLFGYVIVAYLVGSKISRSQTLLLSALYVPLYLSTVAASLGAQTKAIEYAQRLKEIRPDDAIFLQPGNQIFGAVFGVLSLFASLWYMWKIRQSGSAEQPVTSKSSL